MVRKPYPTIVAVLAMTRTGCASVLNTHSSRCTTFESENMR